MGTFFTQAIFTSVFTKCISQNLHSTALHNFQQQLSQLRLLPQCPACLTCCAAVHALYFTLHFTLHLHYAYDTSHFRSCQTLLENPVQLFSLLSLFRTLLDMGCALPSCTLRLFFPFSLADPARCPLVLILPFVFFPFVFQGFLMRRTFVLCTLHALPCICLYPPSSCTLKCQCAGEKIH